MGFRTMKALVDADILVYEASAGHDDDPIEHVIYKLKSRLTQVIEGANCDDSEIFMSGDRRTNWRYEVDPEYKANRPPKPKWHAECRRYLVDYREGRIFDGEADDRVGVSAYLAYEQAAADAKFEGGEPEHFSKVVIVSTDKDLKMVPGWHYSWSKNSPAEPYWIPLELADHWFFTQMITGDAGDNIKGVPGCGPAAAKKVLGLPGELSVMEMLEATADLYKSKKLDMRYFLMQADLLWIQRNHWVRGSQYIWSLCPNKTLPEIFKEHDKQSDEYVLNKGKHGDEEI